MTNKSKFKFYEKSSDNKKPGEGGEVSNQDKNNKNLKLSKVRKSETNTF